MLINGVIMMASNTSGIFDTESPVYSQEFDESNPIFGISFGYCPGENTCSW